MQTNANPGCLPEVYRAVGLIDRNDFPTAFRGFPDRCRRASRVESLLE